jgi:DNA-directed RNA polymerase subunit RPC12/RpoP
VKPKNPLTIFYIFSNSLFIRRKASYSNHMDTGTWTFKCRSCDSAFEIPLTDRERAADFAREKRCPRCGSMPGEASRAEAAGGEHKIIGYRVGKKTHPIIL